MTDRAGAFERLFDGVREGAYIGTIDRATTAVNPFLKTIFGYAPDAPDGDVRPFADDRFFDPLARAAFLTELERNGHVTDHLLRLTRSDGSVAWVEVTAANDPASAGTFVALVRDVSERKRMDDQSRESVPPASASGKNGRARTNDFGRRPRTQQPARDDSVLGGAPCGASG